ncbi:hypothetical protein [Deinococcus roseus]|uniref:Uncharacterized protein n=1 Tax=Deinococcus roseus TaxID=392414 RepID=A0ABQ2DJJ0_9DEIO|nr:hypothetical protein [Deinococcus roseus]GGJ55797.1 hypothetical protein GCM10008938_47480 [Deinococcus roseus]
MTTFNLDHTKLKRLKAVVDLWKTQETLKSTTPKRDRVYLWNHQGKLHFVTHTPSLMVILTMQDAPADAPAGTHWSYSMKELMNATHWSGTSYTLNPTTGTLTSQRNTLQGQSEQDDLPKFDRVIPTRPTVHALKALTPVPGIAAFMTAAEGLSCQFTRHVLVASGEDCYIQTTYAREDETHRDTLLIPLPDTPSLNTPFKTPMEHL